MAAVYLSGFAAYSLSDILTDFMGHILCKRHKIPIQSVRSKKENESMKVKVISLRTNFPYSVKDQRKIKNWNHVDSDTFFKPPWIN